MLSKLKNQTPEKTLTKADIDQLYKLYDQLADIQDLMSENIKTAQAQHGKELIKVKRGDKELEITQAVLWQEMFHHPRGIESDAGKDLRGLYPQVFEFKDKEAAKLAEIQNFEFKQFGFHHTQMTLPNIIRLIKMLLKVLS